MRDGLGEDVFDDRAVHIGQPEVTALEAVGQLLMVDARAGATA